MLRCLFLAFLALGLVGCDVLQRESLSTEVTGRSRTATLAYRANPSFGEFMSPAAWRKLGRAELRALDFTSGGEALEWSTRTAKGRVKVSQPFAISRNECRRFEHSVEGRGKRERVSGVACKSGGGRWSLVS